MSFSDDSHKVESSLIHMASSKVSTAQIEIHEYISYIKITISESHKEATVLWYTTLLSLQYIEY